MEMRSVNFVFVWLIIDQKQMQKYDCLEANTPKVVY